MNNEKPPSIEGSSDEALGQVAHVGLWLYIDLLITSIFSFIYWIVIAAIAGPEVLGITSAATSVSWIILGIVLLGVPIGLQKNVGSIWARDEGTEAMTYLMSSFFFVMIVSIIGNIATYVLIQALGIDIGLESSTISLALALSFISSITSPPKNFLIGTLKTKSLALADILANILKISTGVILIIYGFGSDGALWGYIGSVAVSLILYFEVIRRIKRKRTKAIGYSIGHAIELMRVGFANYLPTTITTIGIQLGVIILLSGTNAVETGTYFIAFSIFNAVLALPTAVLGMLLPALSGMENGQEIVARKMTNTVIAIATPFAFALGAYADFVLGVFGVGYLTGAPILIVLCLSIPIACVVLGSASLLYAVDEYMAVLIIGSAMSIVRVVAYLILVPNDGGMGAAYAFDLGFIAAYLALLLLNKRTREFSLRSAMIPCTIISGAIAFASWYFQLPWYIGVPAILIVSIIVFGRLHLLQKRDVLNIVRAVLSEKAIEKIAPLGELAIRIVFGE